jgi:transposase, IS30 family
VLAYLGGYKQIQLHHEMVYQWIYADKAADGGLYKHLRIASKPYRKQYGKQDRRTKIKNRIAIEGRPEVVETRSRIGGLEGDAVIGKCHNRALLALAEPKSLFTVNGKQANIMAQAAVTHMKTHQDQVHTITFW